MGISPLRHWLEDGGYFSEPIKDANPDPRNFVIREVKQFDDIWVSRIHYPNCTNFEGNKILVTMFDPRDRLKLDPHFEEGNGIIARFPPTKEGALNAFKFARLYNER